MAAYIQQTTVSSRVRPDIESISHIDQTLSDKIPNHNNHNEIIFYFNQRWWSSTLSDKTIDKTFGWPVRKSSQLIFPPEKKCILSAQLAGSGGVVVRSTASWSVDIDLVVLVRRRLVSFLSTSRHGERHERQAASWARKGRSRFILRPKVSVVVQ